MRLTVSYNNSINALYISFLVIVPIDCASLALTGARKHHKRRTYFS